MTQHSTTQRNVSVSIICSLKYWKTVLLNRGKSSGLLFIFVFGCGLFTCRLHFIRRHNSPADALQRSKITRTRLDAERSMLACNYKEIPVHLLVGLHAVCVYMPKRTETPTTERSS